jgi:hypothetical protein
VVVKGKGGDDERVCGGDDDRREKAKVKREWDDLEGQEGPPLENGGGLGQGSSGGCLLSAGSPRLEDW